MGYYLPFGRDIKLGQTFGSNPGWGPNPAGGHNGDDWLTPIGVPVRAAGDGYVLFAGQYDDTYEDNFGWGLNYGGNQVVLNLDGQTGPYVEYGHLSVMYVKSGERVSAGQIIALTGATDGNTGVITGPHCHVGVLPWNYNLNTSTYGRVNPRLYLTDYWQDQPGSLSAQSATISAPAITQEWDEMASAEDIADIVKRVVWGGPNGTMIHNYRLGRGEYAETILGALEGRMQNEILPAVVVAPLQQQLGGLTAKVDALATALAARPDSPITKEEALAQLDASVKASFGEYTPVLVRGDIVQEGK